MKNSLTIKDKTYIIKQMSKNSPMQFVEMAKHLHKESDTVSQFYRRLMKKKRAVQEQDTYEIEAIRAIKFKTTHGVLQRNKPVYIVKWVEYEKLGEINCQDFKSIALVVEFLLDQEYGGVSN